MLIVSKPKSAAATISKGRKEVEDIIHQRDDRFLVICGPCSIHCTKTALQYASRLKELSDRLSSDLCVVLRAYREKPRTTIGWKGLINDPDLNETYQINKGIRISRQLYASIASVGVPLAGEMLDTLSPLFLSDLVSMGGRCSPNLFNSSKKVLGLHHLYSSSRNEEEVLES